MSSSNVTSAPSPICATRSPPICPITRCPMPKRVDVGISPIPSCASTMRRKAPIRASRALSAASTSPAATRPASPGRACSAAIWRISSPFWCATTRCACRLACRIKKFRTLTCWTVRTNCHSTARCRPIWRAGSRACASPTSAMRSPTDCSRWPMIRRVRCRCSRGRVSISRWRASSTTAARRQRISAHTSCSRTISAMSTSSSPGRWPS